MAEQLGIRWLDVGLVALTTATMYLVVVGGIRLFGQRRLASLSGADLGVVLSLGAVVGRTSLLLRPTLLTGVVAVLTLFGIQALLGRLRRARRLDRLVDRPPVPLMSGATVLEANLRACGMSEDDLRQRLRLAGVRHRDEVRCVVLERSGTISVVRQGEVLDPWLFADVPGHRADRLERGLPTQGGAELDGGAPPR
jgi:uncharacterized membrane protein YcaP (DUF421 family)